MQPLPCLVIFCRRPAPGVGKQRLAATIGAAAACDVGLALLECALEDARDWAGPVVLSPAEPADAAWAAGLLRRGVSVLPQSPGNLGERLQSVDAALRAQGARELFFIGSDAPCHEAALYDAARQALLEADVALVPALDGGVTLMAARSPWPMLTDLPWSTIALGAALARRCGDTGLRVAVLPAAFDVDELSDLQRVAAELSADARPARRALCALLRSLRLQQAS